MIEYLDQVVDKDQYRCSLYVEYTVRVGLPGWGGGGGVPSQLLKKIKEKEKLTCHSHSHLIFMAECK